MKSLRQEFLDHIHKVGKNLRFRSPISARIYRKVHDGSYIKDGDRIIDQIQDSVHK